MKRTLLIPAAVLVAAFATWTIARRFIPSYIEYRGEKIKLTRYYLDYDEYKNDPDNIDPSETARVQQLVISAPIARSYDTQQEMIRATFEVKFPGYGAGGLGDGGKGDGSLSGLSVEIPRADKSRYMLFQCRNGKYILIDDFVDSDPPGLAHVRLEGTKLIYSSYDGTRKLIRVPSS